MRTFRRILAATDFSPASQPALDEACRIAADCGARLIVLHAYQVPAVAYISYTPASVYEDFQRALREDSEKRLGVLIAGVRARGVDASGLVKEGFADEEILATAQKEKADLIIMGTHGRRGPSRLVLGSVASRVVSRSSCPVMILREIAPAEHETAAYGRRPAPPLEGSASHS